MNASLKPDKRLAALLRAPGGVDVQDAIARARSRVQQVRAGHADKMAEKAAGIAAAVVEGVSLPELLACAADLREDAANCRSDDIAEAAASLCRLVRYVLSNDKAASAGYDHASAVVKESIRIHAEGLVLLCSPQSAEARKVLVAGLRDLAARIAAG